MEKPIGKLPKIRGIPIEKGNEGDILRNDPNASVYPHNIILDFRRKQLHSSLDINQPAAQVELSGQYNFSAGREINFEVEPTSKEIKKRSMTETKMNENESCWGLDLKLELSLPGSSNASLPAPSQPAYLSSILDSDLGGNSKDELPPLIMMGCTRCLMYLMVSKARPKCPSCINPMLFYKCGVNPAKKLRKSRI